MAIVFPTTFASQSGNVAASTLDANFTYTGTLPSQATTISSAAYTLVGTETILINAGATPYSCTLTQWAAATGVGTAVKLATARTIAITGDVTYTSTGFDGSANVTGTGTVVSASTSTAGKVQLSTSAQAQSNSGSVALTPASIAGNVTVGSAGSILLPGGYIEKWVSVTTTINSNSSYSWPVAFPTACDSVIISFTTPSVFSPSLNYELTINAASTSVSQVAWFWQTTNGGTNGSGSATTIYIRALGH